MPPLLPPPNPWVAEASYMCPCLLPSLPAWVKGWRQWLAGTCVGWARGFAQGSPGCAPNIRCQLGALELLMMHDSCSQGMQLHKGSSSSRSSSWHAGRRGCTQLQSRAASAIVVLLLLLLLVTGMSCRGLWFPSRGVLQPALHPGLCGLQPFVKHAVMPTSVGESSRQRQWNRLRGGLLHWYRSILCKTCVLACHPVLNRAVFWCDPSINAHILIPPSVAVAGPNR